MYARLKSSYHHFGGDVNVGFVGVTCDVAAGASNLLPGLRFAHEDCGPTIEAACEVDVVMMLVLHTLVDAI